MKTYKKIILSVVLGIFALSSVLAFGAQDVTVSVEQTSYPTRIVSLGASATEILFAVGW